MALHKNVFETNPWRGIENWRGENAVDGRYTNRSAAGGQCVISENNKETAEWRVDLGSVVSISHIDIYYRTDNRQSIRYFLIYRFSDHFLESHVQKIVLHNIVVKYMIRVII